MESVNYLGWESDLSTRPPRFFKYCLEVSMNTNQWERLTWKTVYSTILTSSNTKWVSSQLFGCGRAKLGLLGRGHLHHQMFITELLLVWPVGHMDPLLNLCCVYQSERGMGWDFWSTCKRGTVISNQRKRLHVIFTPPELKPASASSRTFPF